MAPLQRLVDRTVEIAERRPVLTVTLLAGLSFVLASAIATGVLQRFPNSGDEYAYLYQAETYARGRLCNPLHPLQPYFETSYIADSGPCVFGVFPPGWPLLVAAAGQAGFPNWLLNPMLGAFTLVAVFLLGRTLYDARVGLVAAGLLLASSMFLFNAASFFSHTLCGLLLTLGAWLAMVARRDQTKGAAALAGWLVGWAVVTRYFAGASVGLAIAVAIAWPAPSGWRRLLWFAIGGLPWVIALAWHNESLVGSPWLLSLSAKDDTSWRWFASGWITRGPDMLVTNLLRFVLWTPPALLIVYALWLKWAPAALRRGFEWIPVAVVASLFFYIGRGGNQYGPRYYYEALPFMVVFVGAMIAAKPGGGEHPHRRRLVTWLAASVALVVPLTGALAWQERRVVTERTDVYTQVRNQRLQRAVVLLAGRVGTIRSMGALDLTRNAIGLTASVIFALDRPGDERDLVGRFPGYRFYRYRWDPATSRGWLEPAVRVAGSNGKSAPPPARPGSARPPVLQR